jgi:acyl-coenzyme A synthetase/AMP-(fatty) acid ligase
LLSHPRVTDVAVIGVYDKDRATELPRAYIVAEEGCDELGREIATWLEGKVASHKRLRGGVVFIETIPKSPSGKILRKELRAIAQRVQSKAVRSAKL